MTTEKTKSPATPFILRPSFSILAFSIVALVGLIVAVGLRQRSMPDFGILNTHNRTELSRKGEAFVTTQNGGKPVEGHPFNMTEIDRDSLPILKKTYSDAQLTEETLRNKWPIAATSLNWITADGRLTARVGVSTAGDIVTFFLPFPTNPESTEPLPFSESEAVAAADDFLRRQIILAPESFGPPVIKSLSQADGKIEISRSRPVPGIYDLSDRIIVHLKGNKPYFFTRRFEPDKIGLGEGVKEQLKFSLTAVLSGVSKFLLAGIAVVFLIRVFRKQRLLLTWPLILVGIMTCFFLANMLSVFPALVCQALFENPARKWNPQYLEEFAAGAGLVAAQTISTAISLIFVMSATALMNLVIYTGTLHLEHESNRHVSGMLKDVLTGRPAGFRPLAKALFFGYGASFVLLGIYAAFFAAMPRVTMYSDMNFQILQTLLDTRSNNVSGILGSGLFGFNCLIEVPFAWLLLTGRFNLTKKAALPIMILMSGSFMMGGFALSAGLNTVVVGMAFCLILTILTDRLGLWPVFVCGWSFASLSSLLWMSGVQPFSFSPWVLAGAALAPCASLLLALRRPSAQAEDQTLVPTMLDRYIEEQRQEQQLQIAARIQTDFLPKDCPNLPNWDLAVRSLPAREVGGDFYDFLELDSDHIGIVIGDISGKSVPGALFMVVATTAFRSFAEEQRLSCAPLLETLNLFLYDDMKRARMFAGATYMMLQPASGGVTLANAGLPQPLLYRASEKQSKYLELNGLPLGSMRKSVYEEAEAVLELGDVLILSSDGVVEALNERDEMFGYETFQNFLDTHAHLPAREILDSIFKAVERHSQGVAQSDDITVLVLKRKA